MRPSAFTAVASVITMPAPPTARDPRWTRCQSVGTPSTVAEYWHIGETKMRLRNSMSRSVIASNSLAIASSHLTGREAAMRRFP